MGDRWSKLTALVLAAGITMIAVWLLSGQSFNARLNYMLHPDPPCQAPAGHLCEKM